MHCGSEFVANSSAWEVVEYLSGFQRTTFHTFKVVHLVTGDMYRMASGFYLRGAIFVNHSIYSLAVIFANLNFAFCVIPT